MTESTKHDALLDEDWGESWADLPAAPPLVYARPKTAQLTLRVPKRMISALKKVAASKSLPYHGLARSWILEGLRSGQLPSAAAQLDDAEAPRSSEQLNLKVDPEMLDELKRFSHDTRQPYHQVARQWVEAGLAREHAVASSRPRPSLRELMILLLDGDGQDRDALHGMTRLQKLLFVIQQELDRESSTFYAYNYGPFDEKVIDSAEALRVNGFLTGGQTGSASSSPPSFEQMIATVMQRAAPPQEREAEVFELSEVGRTMAERLRRSSDAYDELHERVQKLRRKWDRPDLVERVYEAFPELTDRSLITAEVDERRARRQG
jgi:predicted DNA-binding protein (MmcQ/YjbR family)